MRVEIRITAAQMFAFKDAGVEKLTGVDKEHFEKWGFRELVAKRFKQAGYAVLNFQKLEYLHHKEGGFSVEGDTSTSLMKDE